MNNYRGNNLNKYEYMGFPGGSDSKESDCNAETQVLSLRQEDPLEERMATYSSILVWRNSWVEELGRLQEITKNVISSQYDISFQCNSINNHRSFFLEINKRIIIQLFTSVFVYCVSLLLPYSI